MTQTSTLAVLVTLKILRANIHSDKLWDIKHYTKHLLDHIFFPCARGKEGSILTITTLSITYFSHEIF